MPVRSRANTICAGKSCSTACAIMLLPSTRDDTVNVRASYRWPDAAADGTVAAAGAGAWVAANLSASGAGATGSRALRLPACGASGAANDRPALTRSLIAVVLMLNRFAHADTLWTSPRHSICRALRGPRSASIFDASSPPLSAGSAGTRRFRGLPRAVVFADFVRLRRAD